MEKGDNQRKRKETNSTASEDSDTSCCSSSDSLGHPPLKKPNICRANTTWPATCDASLSESDADSEEWEDVEDVSLGESIESFYKAKAAVATSHNQDAQRNVVEISLDIPGTSHSSGQKFTEKHDWSKQIQFYVNRFNKALQLHLHKVHLMCLVASAIDSNEMCNNAELQARALSQLPIHLVPGSSTSGSCTFEMSWFSAFMKWFSASYCESETASREPATPVHEILHKCIEEMSWSKQSNQVLVCLTTMRALGLQARLVRSLRPIPVKCNLLRKVHSKEVSHKERLQKGKAFDEAVVPKKLVKNKGKVSQTKMKSCQLKRNSERQGSRKHLRRQSVPKHGTTDSEPEDDCIKDSPPSDKTDINNWIEVYSPKEKKWICVNCAGGHIDRPDLCEQNATSPICYVIAVDNENCVKDVTKRYASKWMYETEKLRAPLVWWENTLKPYRTKLINRDKEEDEHLQIQLEQKPLPTTVSEYKNHHLYVLKRHLLKFEALYPESATILGYCRGEAVYSRNCVHNLHTKETWMKQALAIKHGEKPYKMVKARQRKNKSHDPLLPLYGQWQTELYIPPAAVDGKVPRNEYGNVELFQPSMLPMGTVHLQINGLHRVAQKIGVDCAPAMVGWDYHGGFCHPVFDGYVVCKEFTDVLLDNWEKENAEREQKMNQKRRIQAEKNWKNLVTGVLIRERLHDRFHKTVPGGSEDVIDSWPLNKFNNPKR